MGVVTTVVVGDVGEEPPMIPVAPVGAGLASPLVRPSPPHLGAGKLQVIAATLTILPASAAVDSPGSMVVMDFW